MFMGQFLGTEANLPFPYFQQAENYLGSGQVPANL
jgi:hypothetical protein